MRVAKPSQLQVEAGQVEALTTSERVKERGERPHRVAAIFSVYDRRSKFDAPNWVGGLVCNALRRR